MELPRTISIGELAARSGVAPSALRFYEAQGLIHAERSGGNQRRFHRSVLRRVAVIQAGRRAGIPLARIGAALDELPVDRAPTKRDWQRLTTAWRRDLDERIALLERIRDDLGSCIGCGCLSLRRCAVLNPHDVAAESGAGARALLPN